MFEVLVSACCHSEYGARILIREPLKFKIYSRAWAAMSRVYQEAISSTLALSGEYTHISVVVQEAE